MLVDAFHVALEDRIGAFDGVGMPVAILPLVLGMLHGAMFGKLPGRLRDSACALSVMRRVSRLMFSRTIGTMLAIECPSVWNERAEPPRSTKVSDHIFVVVAARVGPQAFLLADVGFVHLDLLPRPPIGSMPRTRMASRTRCDMNHAVFRVTPKVR